MIEVGQVRMWKAEAGMKVLQGKKFVISAGPMPLPPAFIKDRLFRVTYLDGRMSDYYETTINKLSQLL